MDLEDSRKLCIKNSIWYYENDKVSVPVPSRPILNHVTHSLTTIIVHLLAKLRSSVKDFMDW